MKYYSTQRPVMPGSYPKEGAVSIENYNDRIFVPEIGREAWGAIEYNRVLTAKELTDYELTPQGMRTWFAVTRHVYDDGKVVSLITDTVESVMQPTQASRKTRRGYVYIDWFESRGAAKAFVEESKGAEKS